MPKASSTSMWMQMGIEYAERASESQKGNYVHDETRFSMAAHLMAALALEGAANDVAEAILTKWAWQRFERIDVGLKWFLISRLVGQEPLKPSAGPLQTVEQLKRIRDGFVHPKPEERGDDLMLRVNSESALKRNVARDTMLHDGDVVYVGYEKLHAKFSATSANTAVERALSALRKLREITGSERLEWVEGYATDSRFPAL